MPRNSYFIRPSVANLDAVNVVIASTPKPDYLMLDKLILTLFSQGVEVVFVVNKTDLGNEVVEEVKNHYAETDCKIVSVSASTGEGVEELKKVLSGKLVAFAGQSAVGKSSLVNALFGLNLRTNEVSEKTQRGRHTTTVAEIFCMGDIRIVDTPGFSVVKPDIKSEELALFYPEYFSRLQDCKYRTCTHINEPDCRVRKDVEGGLLSAERYLRYKTIFNEIKQDENNKY
jgi:ribosome biogenesis GTPase